MVDDTGARLVLPVNECEHQQEPPSAAMTMASKPAFLSDLDGTLVGLFEGTTTGKLAFKI